MICSFVFHLSLKSILPQSHPQTLVLAWISSYFISVTRIDCYHRSPSSRFCHFTLMKHTRSYTCDLRVSLNIQARLMKAWTRCSWLVLLTRGSLFPLWCFDLPSFSILSLYFIIYELLGYWNIFSRRAACSLSICWGCWINGIFGSF